MSEADGGLRSMIEELSQPRGGTTETLGGMNGYDVRDSNLFGLLFFSRYCPAIYPTGSQTTPGPSSQNQGAAFHWDTSFPPIIGDRRTREGVQGGE